MVAKVFGEISAYIEKILKVHTVNDYARYTVAPG